MKKFLLVLSCFVFAVCAKAAEYEISTALSSPYGMFSTFSVFGDATVSDLIIGAESKDGVTPTGFILPVYKPIQETYLEAGSISFGGNLNVKKDLFFDAPNQTYGNVKVTSYSSATVQQNTFFDMNFTTIEIPVLYAGTLVTGPLSLPYPATINNLYTASFSVRNGNSTFTFPQVRGTTFGNDIRMETLSSQCGTSNQGHYYGAWVTCTGGSCPADTCEGNDRIAQFTCTDGEEKSKNCVDVRNVDFTTEDIAMEPYISGVTSYYRKCVYQNSVEPTNRVQCEPEALASGEADFLNTIVGVIKPCGDDAENSCIKLCRLYEGNGGCEHSARSCYIRNTTLFGSDCGASGWEMGSGLECKDSYTRALYTIYTCPQGSDYTDRPDRGDSHTLTFSQYRDVACAGKNVEKDETDTYCGTNFLTVNFIGK